MRKKSLWVAVCLCFCLCAVRQAAASSGNPESHYDRGVSLYEKQRYAAAQAEFEKAAREAGQGDAALLEKTSCYRALCASQMRQTNAEELLGRFLDDYPYSIRANDVRFALGTLYHEQGDYGRAYDEYRTVDPYELDFSDYDQYNFRTAMPPICAATRRPPTAISRIARSVPDICSRDLLYSLYRLCEGRFGRGQAGVLLALAADPSYEPVVPFYLLQIEFQQGNYPYVIEHGIPLLAKSTESRQREISRIVSEAYFHQGDYPHALAYMDNYEKLGGTMGREELYLAGYCYYADREYDRAVERLSQVASGSDALAQNACFHLADCYLQTGDRAKAMSAFGLASAADYDPEIKEEAMFDYGKLQYEQGGGVFGRCDRRAQQLHRVVSFVAPRGGGARAAAGPPISIPATTTRPTRRSSWFPIPTTT